MKKSILLWIISLLVMGMIVLFSIEGSRIFIFDLFLCILLFLKENILTLLAAFFLVKGKFIFTLFLKKIVLLSATGLGKRYVIEKVIHHNIKIHFLDHISEDIKHLILYVKKNFKNFPVVKQIIAGFVFLASLGFVGKFMGGMLAMKVFIAKFWSFLLVIFLKVSTAIVYFFTDYLWGGWIEPIVEVVIFTWLLSWMEKVPFLAKTIRTVFGFFSLFFVWIEYMLEKVFHVPVQTFLKWLVKKIQNIIYKIIGYKRVSARKRLIKIRLLNPNSHSTLLDKRKKSLEKKKVRRYLSSHVRLSKKRKERIKNYL